MLRTTVFILGFAVFLYILIGYVESSEIKLISPVGAASRSIIPGWGQIYTNSKLSGAVIFLSVGLLGAGGVRADAIYRDFYNSKYREAVLSDSGQADYYFDRSNQYYKLSRFLLYTAAGIWAYSVIDAYVDAHIHNARQRMRMLDINDERIRQLKMEPGIDGVGSLYSRARSIVFDTPEVKESGNPFFNSASSVWTVYSASRDFNKR